MLQLQTNVPPPITRRSHKNKKYPFETMRVDDFFFVAGKKRNTIRTYFSTMGQKHNIKLKSELMYARQIKGLWSPCEPTDKGATMGVGVWRVE